MDEIKKISFKGQSIFIGIDVHHKSWTVCILVGNIEHTVFSQPPSAKLLANYLRRYFLDANYYSAYEAGFCGYWVHEALEAEGINNIIANPADIPTTNKEKRRKMDPADSRKLAKCLRAGVLTGIDIRDREKQEDRSLVRLRALLVKDQTRNKNRIKGILKVFGIDISEETIKSHWSKQYLQYLRRVSTKFSTLSYTLTFMLDNLENSRQFVTEVTRQIRKLSLEPRYIDAVECLITIPGISILTAMIILTELGNINKYHRLDKLVSYIGLVPDERSSGDKENKLSMTRRGNKFLKNVIIESAWTAVRKDPALLQSYTEYCKRMLKTKAIIKISRKLVNRIRYVLLNEENYKILVA
jgi:transposase